MKKAPSTIERLEVRRQKGQIWSHVRKKWLNETPEEAVRQEYLCVLVNEYGFKLDQIDEEATLPGKRGNKHARADFVIWRTVEEKRNGETALIVVECKADNVAIDQHAYKEIGEAADIPIQIRGDLQAILAEAAEGRAT